MSDSSTKAMVTSYGIISAIGANAVENLQSLFNKKAGIGDINYLQTVHRLPMGTVVESNEELAKRAGVLKTLPRTALLSIIAAQEAIAPIKDKLAGFRVGFISANTVGGTDLTEIEFDKIMSHQKINPRHIAYHECSSITDLTADAIGLKDAWTSTISTACSSSANTIMMGSRLIEQDKFDIIIAGGADSLSKFTLNGFNSLMILDKQLCQPFDENRRGLNIGEGAAYLVLMNHQTAKTLDQKACAVINGYANANDAHHQTASSPEGIGNQLAMKGALEKANLKPSDIDYINLHGTGTANNDSSEGIAISKIFGEHPIPPASSTKCYTGHTLGAAGAIEAVFSIFAIEHQNTWAHLRLENPIQELTWIPNTDIKRQNIEHVLSNSFGFGGNCSALVITKP